MEQNVSLMPKQLCRLSATSLPILSAQTHQSPKNEYPLELAKGKVSCVDTSTPFGCLDLRRGF